MAFGLVHLKVSSLAAIAMVKLSHNINTNDTKE
jgi:hypothetical protein